MNDLVGPWVRRFLVEYVIGERNYSPNTQHSYRDTFRLLLPLAVKQCRCTVENLTMNGIKPKLLREFTRYLEQVRHCGPSTINQRLAALRAWSRFVAANSPEHLEWSTQLQTVHLKKHAPCSGKLSGERRNAGASEPTGPACRSGHSRSRQCPLWKVTAEVLRDVVRNRSAHQGVFLNRNGESLTRYGVHILVKRYASQAAVKAPTLRNKRVGPHCIRHSTAMALLRSGVDINTIRIWLGPVSLQTTHIYAESDLKMKAKALARCEAPLVKDAKRRSNEKGLMSFLRSL